MGWIRHHAIIVTAWDEERAKEAYSKACSLFSGYAGDAPDGIYIMPRFVSPIMESPMSGYYTFLVGPDGSKEGRDLSDLCNDRRDLYINWLDSMYTDEHGDLNIDYVEVFYGDDGGEAGIVRHSGKGGKILMSNTRSRGTSVVDLRTAPAAGVRAPWGHRSTTV